MLTLNQTPGNNNQTLWCLRLRGEGNNLISNSTFGSATGWTLTGDWAIASGVAIYTYSANASGDLQMTLPAATGVPYILEYEVTAVAGTGYNLYLRGGASGTLFNATQIGLDLTLGKHSVRFTGDSGGGTIFRIGASGFGASDSISIDNVKVRKIENIIYLSTRDITLTNAYDGQALNFDSSLTEISSPSTIQQGGGTGEVSTYSFNISRYVSNAGFNSFFNELYPASEGGFIVSRLVDIGVCWVGATADTQITWLMRGRVIDYNYQQRILSLTVFQESEISNKEVPYYAVQKDYDNGVGYYPYCPEDSIGVMIPVVYGDFTRGTTGGSESFLWDVALSPAIPIHKRLTKFIVSSHKCFETAEDQALFTSAEVIFKYISGLQTYMFIQNNVLTDSSTVNNYAHHTLSMTDRGSRLIGALKLRLAEPGESSSSTVTDFDEVLDKSTTTYSELNAVATGDNQLSLKVIGSASTDEIGFLGTADEDVGVYLMVSTDGGGNRNYSLTYYNNTLSTPAGDSVPTTGTLTSATASTKLHQFGTNTDGKKDAIIPWAIDEVCGLDFILRNTETTVGNKIRIYYGWVYLSNIIVYAPNWARSLRDSGGGRR